MPYISKKINWVEFLWSLKLGLCNLLVKTMWKIIIINPIINFPLAWFLALHMNVKVLHSSLFSTKDKPFILKAMFDEDSSGCYLTQKGRLICVWFLTFHFIPKQGTLTCSFLSVFGWWKWGRRLSVLSLYWTQGGLAVSFRCTLFPVGKFVCHFSI